MVEGGVAAEADAGPGEYEQHGGDGDEPDVPRQCGEGVVGELGDDAQAGVNGKAEGIGGDTYFAVIEFSTPVHAEALLSYGNWSKKGSPHVEDQMKLLSRKEMRPIWRDRKDVEAHLEARKVF